MRSNNFIVIVNSINFVSISSHLIRNNKFLFRHKKMLKRAKNVIFLSIWSQFTQNPDANSANDIVSSVKNLRNIYCSTLERIFKE